MKHETLFSKFSRKCKKFSLLGALQNVELMAVSILLLFLVSKSTYFCEIEKPANRGLLLKKLYFCLLRSIYILNFVNPQNELPKVETQTDLNTFKDQFVTIIVTFIENYSKINAMEKKQRNE